MDLIETEIIDQTKESLCFFYDKAPDTEIDECVSSQDKVFAVPYVFIKSAIEKSMKTNSSVFVYLDIAIGEWQETLFRPDWTEGIVEINSGTVVSTEILLTISA